MKECIGKVRVTYIAGLLRELEVWRVPGTVTSTQQAVKNDNLLKTAYFIFKTENRVNELTFML